MGDRRIRTVLYGDQRIEATELDLLHTPALQRLYELHQLGLTDRVFVDASHSRLQHVIGVLEQVERILDAICRNLERRARRTLKYRDRQGKRTSFSGTNAANYVRTTRRAARLMGLLHDLTHAPYGHTLEDEIELQPQKHDEPERQADAFYRLICQYLGWLAIDSGHLNDDDRVEPGENVECRAALHAFLDAPALVAPRSDDVFRVYLAGLAAEAIRNAPANRAERSLFQSDRVQLLQDIRFAMRALLWLEALHDDKLEDALTNASAVVGQESKPRRVLEDGAYAFEQLIDAVLGRLGEKPTDVDRRFHLSRDAFLLDVIGNTICADLLDYAKRDSHFAALKLDYDVDRIVENFTLVSHRPVRQDLSRGQKYQSVEPMLRTAISMFSHKLRIDMPGELMNLLQVRFYVYQRVLFHPTKCIAGAMLGSAVQLIGWERLPSQYLFVGDDVFLHEVGEVARVVRALLQQHRSTGITVDDVLVNCVKRLISVPGGGLAASAEALLVARKAEPIETVIVDLTAAIRLLNRLGARRYHRPIFRLLPNVAVPELHLGAAQVAEIFRNASTRAAAERAVEHRAGLPRGAVTIHCPKGDGPKKIAEILLLYEDTDKEIVHPLREIRQLNPQVFSEHEAAVLALERMYASMWRLVVSVAPPFVARYQAINAEIQTVLFSTLHGAIVGEAPDPSLKGRVDNDPAMVRELAEPDDTDKAFAPSVRVIFPDGREEDRTVPFMDVADRAVARLSEVDPRIAGRVTTGRAAAHDSQDVATADLVAAAIPLRQLFKENSAAELLGESLDAQHDLLGKEQPQTKTPRKRV